MARNAPQKMPTHCVLVDKGVLALVELNQQLVPRVFQLAQTGRREKEKLKKRNTPYGGLRARVVLDPPKLENTLKMCFRSW